MFERAIDQDDVETSKGLKFKWLIDLWKTLNKYCQGILSAKVEVSFFANVLQMSLSVLFEEIIMQECVDVYFVIWFTTQMVCFLFFLTWQKLKDTLARS